MYLTLGSLSMCMSPLTPILILYGPLHKPAEKALHVRETLNVLFGFHGSTCRNKDSQWSMRIVVNKSLGL